MYLKVSQFHGCICKLDQGTFSNVKNLPLPKYDQEVKEEPQGTATTATLLWSCFRRVSSLTADFCFKNSPLQAQQAAFI
jgi:hypothetical protein